MSYMNFNNAFIATFDSEDAAHEFLMQKEVYEIFCVGKYWYFRTDLPTKSIMMYTSDLCRVEEGVYEDAHKRFFSGRREKSTLELTHTGDSGRLRHGISYE